jgi:hypothetical protein
MSISGSLGCAGGHDIAPPLPVQPAISQDMGFRASSRAVAPEQPHFRCTATISFSPTGHHSPVCESGLRRVPTSVALAAL